MVDSRTDSPYIGPVMWSPEQTQYLEEVLGIQASSLAVAQEAPPQTMVLTYPLDQDARTLLDKILGSIQLKNYTHLELDQISLSEVPEGHQAKTILSFIEYPTGKSEFDGTTWYVMPPLATMLGANAEVVARKKETWGIMQQFAREQI